MRVRPAAFTGVVLVVALAPQVCGKNVQDNVKPPAGDNRSASGYGTVSSPGRGSHNHDRSYDACQLTVGKDGSDP
jgi:hypothetical protein